MSKKTPKRNQTVSDYAGFSPVSLPASPLVSSPNKNLTGPPRIIRDIVADLYNNIQRWNALHIEGCSLVKRIASIKAENSSGYSKQLEEFINELYLVIDKMKHYRDFFIKVISQAQAFAMLSNVTNPVFLTMDATHMSLLIRSISENYQKEFEVKQMVLQNIAFAKNINEAMFLATLWTHQVNVSESTSLQLESLLVETGHRLMT